jgi:hypothetical protein
VSPGGFGTGEHELKIYYDGVRAYQSRIVAPLVRWMLARKFPEAAEGRWQVSFPPLDVPTQAELIEMRAKQAQTDAVYVSAGVLSSEEVAVSRFGGTEYSFETSLDEDARAEALATEMEPIDDPEEDPNATEPADPENTDPAQTDDDPAAADE